MSSHDAVVRCSIFLGLLVFHTLTCVKIVESVALPSTECVKPLASSIVGDRFSAATLRDITNAFNTVTNDTKEIDYLIPNMFNLSSTDPTYVFRLPQEESINQSVVIMRKSDFMQPIFPNLTRSYIQLMKGKEMVSKDDDGDAPNQVESSAQVWEAESVSGDNPTLLLNLQTERNFFEYVNELNREYKHRPSKAEGSDDEWSLLGLHGWRGTLSKPHNADGPILSGCFFAYVSGLKCHCGAEFVKRIVRFDELTNAATKFCISLECNIPECRNEKPKMPNSTEKTVQKWDLPGKMLDDKLEHNVMQVMANSNAGQNYSQAKYSITNMHADHSDVDVYISRANDPFGHSTKWNMKNSSFNPQEDERKKRAVVELYSMIKCSTGCDPIVFKGYGCYCGFLGNGLAVDGIDRCCKLHDKCYENSNCISYLQYFVPYLWKCYRGKPLCAIDHGEWGGPNSCAARLCNCDLMLSRCLRQFVCPQKRAICRTSKSRMLQNILFNF